MADHVCDIHGTEFFRRGNMRGYAHPIGEKDESTGKYPEGWCNEDAEEVAKLPARTPQPIPLAEGEHIVTEAQRLGARVTSVDNFKNRAVAISYAKDLLCAGVIDKEKLIGYADKFLNYIENK